MLSHVSSSMDIDRVLTPENMGWNILLKREDWERVSLEWLPIWTDFMVYPQGIKDIMDKTKLIVNMRLITQQNGCGITWANIARDLDDKVLMKSFIENSKTDRWSVLAIDGPVWSHILEVWQKIFIWLPTGRIK